MKDYKIGWRQSKNVRSNIVSLLENLIEEVNDINRLQMQIVQKQLLDNNVITSEDTLTQELELMLNDGLSFETVDIYNNISEITKKQEEIKQTVSSISHNLADDSDLIFMGLVDAGEEIVSQHDDLDMQIGNLKEEIDEMGE